MLLCISVTLGILVGLAAVYLFDPREIRNLETYRPPSNTFIYDDSGLIIGSFARERRVIAQYEDYPKALYDAVVSIEDKDFESHSGFAVWRVLSAGYHDAVKRRNAQGASTLTMQLARNLFLSPERTYSRKFRELLLAIQLERHFTKAQIFTLYANQIYLGNGIYGFATGAQFYFGKPAKDLRLEEAALLAALPKAPNIYSPLRNPERALGRRNLVISAMLSARKISASEADEAKKKPLVLNLHEHPNSLAPYFVEEVRQYLERKYGSEQLFERGLRVYTTLNVGMQRTANRAVLDGLSAYEHRHGWHAKLENVRTLGGDPLTYRLPDWSESIEPGAFVHALVTSIKESSVAVRLGNYNATIRDEDVAWTGHTVSQMLSPGDIVYVQVLATGSASHAVVRLEADFGIQGALLAIDNSNGDIKAMVGGRDFNQSQFNRTTQALRQVGSSFKPYVYAAAIDQGAMPDDIVIDAPVIFRTASGAYSPHNYDQKFEGAITLRHALAESRNIPALKVAQSLGIQNVIAYAHRFGITESIPAYLPIALGAVELTLLEHSSAFSVFPNDGVRVVPRYVVRVTDYEGHVLEQNDPVVQDVISTRTARIMTSMLREVVLHGTAVAANRLKIPVAGKTGTTNDFTDAWFVGFSPRLTCGVWIGFDEKHSLGNKETGAMAALPIWIDFMASTVSRDDRGLDFRPFNDEKLIAKQDKAHAMSQSSLKQLLKPSMESRPKRVDVILPATHHDDSDVKATQHNY